MKKTLEELASLVGGSVTGDKSTVITGAASLEDAGPGDITFLAGKKHISLARQTRASAVIAPGGLEGVPNLIIVKNPQLAFAAVLDALRPPKLPSAGVHARAEVHPNARLGKDVSIQAFCVVEEGASVGDGSILFPGVYVGRDASVGAGCILYPGVSVREDCMLGDRVIIHANSVIGSDGFGYARDGSRYIKVPQRGTVRIEDDVEIGACVTIDRATLGETVIGKGTKIDNLVQIAHNVTVGEDTVIVAQAGIAGSTKIGSRVQLGGQVGVAGHISIGDGSGIGAKSGVVQDTPPGSFCSGIPAIPHTEWLRAQSVYAKLPELKKKIAELEKRLAGLESAKGKDNQ